MLKQRVGRYCQSKFSEGSTFSVTSIWIGCPWNTLKVWTPSCTSVWWDQEVPESPRGACELCRLVLTCLSAHFTFVPLCILCENHPGAIPRLHTWYAQSNYYFNIGHFFTIKIERLAYPTCHRKNWSLIFWLILCICQWLVYQKELFDSSEITWDL